MTIRKVHSTHAREAALKKIHSIKNRLEDIEVALGEYESLKRFNYGHDGDLGYILGLLDQAYTFMKEPRS